MLLHFILIAIQVACLVAALNEGTIWLIVLTAMLLGTNIAFALCSHLVSRR